MSEVKRVKIQSFIESQIPEFLNSESSLFKEFLEQYYISQEHQTGVTDLTLIYRNIKALIILIMKHFTAQLEFVLSLLML
jgi:hypothetical protein